MAKGALYDEMPKWELLRIISPMTEERMEQSMGHQLEAEARGDWKTADRINQWLMGAYRTYGEWAKGILPEMRKSFLKRYQAAIRKKRTSDE